MAVESRTPSSSSVSRTRGDVVLGLVLDGAPVGLMRLLERAGPLSDWMRSMMRRLPSRHSAARPVGGVVRHMCGPRVDEEVERLAGVGVQPAEDRVDRVAAAPAPSRRARCGRGTPRRRRTRPPRSPRARTGPARSRSPGPCRCPSRARRGGAGSGRWRSTSSQSDVRGAAAMHWSKRTPPRRQARRSSGCGHGVRRSTRDGRPGERQRPRRPCSRKPPRHPAGFSFTARACATPSPGRWSTSCPPRRARRGRGRSACPAGSSARA